MQALLGFLTKRQEIQYTKQLQAIMNAIYNIIGVF